MTCPDFLFALSQSYEITATNEKWMKDSEWVSEWVSDWKRKKWPSNWPSKSEKT